jgi:hypothetical protein
MSSFDGGESLAELYHQPQCQRFIHVGIVSRRRRRVILMSEVAQGSIKVWVSGRSKVAPSAVFALLKDAATWPTWTMFDAFELPRVRRTDRRGLHPRVFDRDHADARAGGRTRARSKAELHPLVRVSFSELPCRCRSRSHRRGGTAIDWRASFDPKYPGTGWFWRLFMTAVLRKVTTDLAAGAEK